MSRKRREKRAARLSWEAKEALARLAEPSPVHLALRDFMEAAQGMTVALPAGARVRFEEVQAAINAAGAGFKAATKGFQDAVIALEPFKPPPSRWRF